WRSTDGRRPELFLTGAAGPLGPAARPSFRIPEGQHGAGECARRRDGRGGGGGTAPGRVYRGDAVGPGQGDQRDARGDDQVQGGGGPVRPGDRRGRRHVVHRVGGRGRAVQGGERAARRGPGGGQHGGRPRA